MNTRNTFLLLAAVCGLVGLADSRRSSWRYRDEESQSGSSSAEPDWLCIASWNLVSCLTSLAQGRVEDFQRAGCCKKVTNYCKEDVYCYFGSVCSEIEKCKNPVKNTVKHRSLNHESDEWEDMKPTVLSEDELEASYLV